MKIFKYSLLFLTFNYAVAQSGSFWGEKPTYNFSGFIDIFYVYDFNKPESIRRQSFFYNHNRHNEFNLNLGLVQFNLNHPKYRAVLALHTGTYVEDNYSAEPGILKMINEAKIGVSLNKRNNLWLDAGIMNSHIGFESALSIDNLTLTRSLAAESSPFFLTGVKVTFNPSEKWELSGMVCNGWQRIQKVQGNSLLSFGTQVLYKSSEQLVLNWSTFIGTDDPDSTRRMRYFNNFYGKFQFLEKIVLIVGFDIGFQQRTKNSSEYYNWFTPVFIGQYSFRENFKTAIRFEYFNDENEIIIPTGSPNGFKTLSTSLNFDYFPIPELACRIEGRWLSSKDDIFTREGKSTNNDFFISTSIALRFGN